jgi:3-hexulose-6-phosphate synthase
LDRSLEILREAAPYIDIAEIGTPLVFREGMAAARRIRQEFPKLRLLADFKIMDAGREEALIAFEAGCDIVTVLGVTQDNTLRGAVEAAQQAGKQIMVDLMQVSDQAERSRQLLAMGCDYLCVHTAYDLHQQQAATPLHDLELLRKALPAAALAVAGGINLEMLEAVAPFHPAIVIVGGAIGRAASPGEAARRLRQKLEGLA